MKHAHFSPFWSHDNNNWSNGGYWSSDSNTQTPIVTTFIAVDFAGGAADGLLGGAFQGFDPDVTGNLTVGLGATAYDLPGVDSRAASLQHVIAGSSVVDPTVLVDLNFATPANGPDNGSITDIGIASSTLGFSSLVIPLGNALAGTTLGGELSPLVGLASGLLPGYDKHGGLPTGGSTTARPLFFGSAGLGLSQTLTLLGQTTTTSGGGSLTLTRADADAVVNTVNGAATLFGDTGALVSDVITGNILAAVTEGVATLGAGTALIGDVGTLINDASKQAPPDLPAIKNPALSLDLNTQDSQSFSLGLGTPTQVQENLNVQITADKFGAYALGQVLALYAPELVADLSGNGTQTAESLFSQLAQGVAGLANTVVSGVTNSGNQVQSLVGGPDIGISATLVTTENNDLAGGSVSNSQTFSLNFESNAQGFYDLGTAAQDVLLPVLVGLLETPAGQEALQIGGDILQQIDSKFGGGAASLPDTQHAAVALPETHMMNLGFGF
jgi:hypothetical protein